MALKSLAVAVPSSATTLYTCPSTIEASVHGLVFCNTTGSALTLSFRHRSQSTGTTVTLASSLSVPANSTVTWPKPINMQAGDYISATSSVASGLVVLYSVYEGTSTPIAQGFVVRGTWSSSASYVANDVVSYSSVAYVAIQASTNQQPDTATAYWMPLATAGNSGGGFSQYQVLKVVSLRL